LVKPVPEAKGEHAHKVLDCYLDTPLNYCGKNDFGIRSAAKSMPQVLQFALKAAEIVNLSIIDNHVPAIGRDHRLMTKGREIQNG
jgi:hypothetical protein